MTTTLTEEVNVPANFYKGAQPTSHQLRRRRAVLKMLQGLKGRVLDFGCGYGDLAYAISQTNEVCGVDLDPQRVAFAAKEYAPLEFKQCSTADAPYPDQSFDIVASIVVINFIPDAASHLRAIRRLLKDDGHLILACKSDDVLRNGVRRMFGRPPFRASYICVAVKKSANCWRNIISRSNANRIFMTPRSLVGKTWETRHFERWRRSYPWRTSPARRDIF